LANGPKKTIIHHSKKCYERKNTIKTLCRASVKIDGYLFTFCRLYYQQKFPALVIAIAIFAASGKCIYDLPFTNYLTTKP